MLTFFLVLFLFLCFILAGVILLQSGGSSGMGAAFGGGDAANSVFGTSRNDVLVKITTTLATLFVLSCIGFSLSATKFSKPVIHAPVIEEPIEVSSQGE